MTVVQVVQGGAPHHAPWVVQVVHTPVGGAPLHHAPRPTGRVVQAAGGSP